MDTVDSQILDGGPPQRLIGPPIYNLAKVETIVPRLLAIVGAYSSLRTFKSTNGMHPAMTSAAI
jgi:hypothetical protein